MSDKNEKIVQIKASEPVSAKAPTIMAIIPEKIKFMTWFSTALGQYESLKPHHFHEVQAYFKGLKIQDPETAERYEQGMKKFGFIMENK